MLYHTVWMCYPNISDKALSALTIVKIIKTSMSGSDIGDIAENIAFQIMLSTIARSATYSYSSSIPLFITAGIVGIYSAKYILDKVTTPETIINNIPSNSNYRCKYDYNFNEIF